MGLTMKTFLVCLGPHDCSSESYQRICNHIVAHYGRAMNGFRCGWVLTSDHTADYIRDGILLAAGHLDKLIVAKIGDEAAWHGLNPLDADWLIEQL